jgi:hypothetical protein
VATYRFYFLDGASHIYEAEERDFANDKEAIDTGPQMHLRHGGDYAMEIWQATRLVHRQKVTEPPRLDGLRSTREA